MQYKSAIYISVYIHTLTYSDIHTLTGYASYPIYLLQRSALDIYTPVLDHAAKTGVVDLRFRSLNPAVEPKYMGMTGAETKMYNVLDVERAGDFIGVCEGELDTITLSHCVGISCIGVPGANSWKKHYTRLLADFERVFVFADGDQAGTEFARSLARELPVTIVQLPEGEDVNSLFVKHGAGYIKDKAGIA
jgi:5S rRNA maturation endonuclease (ribonuclease M5)